MGIKLPAGTRPEDLANVRFMAKTLDLARTTVTDGEITDDSFADRTGNTIIGRATNTAGKPADIGLAPGQFFANRAGTLVGTTIVDADLPASIARDSEVTTAANAAQAAAEATALTYASLDQFVLAGRVFG